MNSAQAEWQLVEAMKRLETAADKVVQTNGYTGEAKKMRLLTELIKEQIRNENSMRTARPIR
ncbi:MAG: hypothetical protein KDD38_00405 [Bdellovibrionales bacterium]|nr:hypothetical protein [Bdellovibrionales bacterium]